jgi:large subunit ribosomal protein L32
MAVPRNRVSNAKKNSRRSHHALKPKNVAACPSCGEPKRPHLLCSHCGVYKGQKVIDIKE